MLQETWVYLKNVPTGVWFLGSIGIYYIKKNYTINTMEKMHAEQIERLIRIEAKIDKQQGTKKY